MPANLPAVSLGMSWDSAEADELERRVFSSWSMGCEAGDCGAESVTAESLMTALWWISGMSERKRPDGRCAIAMLVILCDFYIAKFYCKMLL